MSTENLDSGTITANGSTTGVDKDVSSRERETGTTIYVTGTFDSASVQPQISPDGTNWFDVGTPITANGFLTITDDFSFIRLTTASIATLAALSYWIK